MDQELFGRWKAGEPPFDGHVLHPDVLLQIAELRAALRGLVAALTQSAGNQSPRLLAFEDWHEHDGYVTESRAAAWSDVEEMLETDESLYAARQGDTHVHRAFYAADRSFLFRFYVLD
jgi:hypothetical protein